MYKQYQLRDFSDINVYINRLYRLDQFLLLNAKDFNGEKKHIDENRTVSAKGQ